MEITQSEIYNDFSEIRSGHNENVAEFGIKYSKGLVLKPSGEIDTSKLYEPNIVFLESIKLTDKDHLEGVVIENVMVVVAHGFYDYVNHNWIFTDSQNIENFVEKFNEVYAPKHNVPVIGLVISCQDQEMTYVARPNKFKVLLTRQVGRYASKRDEILANFDIYSQIKVPFLSLDKTKSPVITSFGKFVNINSYPSTRDNHISRLEIFINDGKFNNLDEYVIFHEINIVN